MHASKVWASVESLYENHVSGVIIGIVAYIDLLMFTAAIERIRGEGRSLTEFDHKRTLIIGPR